MLEAPTFSSEQAAASQQERLLSFDFIGARTKATVFLTQEGAKPASIVEALIFPSEIDTLASYLTDHGLVFTYERSDSLDQAKTIFLIGKTPENLAELLAARKERDSQVHARKLGKALGHPETAVAAFLSQHTLRLNNVPQDPEVNFAPFMFSQDHWEEELAMVKAQAQIVKEKFPKLYEEVTRSFPWRR